MDILEKLVMPATLTLVLLSGCDRSKMHVAADAVDANPAAESHTPPSPPPAPVPRLKAYGSLMFKTEEQKVRTSACLSLDEIPANAHYDGVEPVFNALIAAFKAKDEKAYNTMTVTEQSGAGRKCPQTMKEFFSEFEGFTLQRIEHVYAFDGLVLVDAVLRMPERDFTFAYAFERGPQSNLKFAPCSERTPFYAAVRSWLSDPRVGDEFNPRCPAELIERATHRVPIGSDSAQAGALLLRGASVEDPSDLRATVMRVTAALKAIERAVAAKDMRRLQKHMGTRGAAKVVEWWPTATAEQRAAYADAVTGVEPFFVFDASPLVIAYVRQKGTIQVMYFVPAADGRLIWMNSALITDADGLFKSGPLRESAALPNPFSNYRIN
jgi:hypothetical protein